MNRRLPPMNDHDPAKENTKSLLCLATYGKATNRRIEFVIQ